MGGKVEGVGEGAGKEGEGGRKEPTRSRGELGGVGCALNIRKQQERSPPITLRQTSPSPQ